MADDSAAHDAEESRRYAEERFKRMMDRAQSKVSSGHPKDLTCEFVL